MSSSTYRDWYLSAAARERRRASDDTAGPDKKSPGLNTIFGAFPASLAVTAAASCIALPTLTVESAGTRAHGPA